MIKRTTIRRETDFEIEGPFGLKARLFGRDLTTVMLLMICAGGILYLIWQHDHNITESLKLVERNQQMLYEQMEDMIYVMSLPEQQRDKLKMAMPDSLRKKLREGQ